MNKNDWETICKVANMKKFDCPPIGFIIDSPWLPGWHEVSHYDYYFDDEVWFDSNLEAVNKFPDITFLPGFWAEFGMVGEPSAFGSRTVWNEYDTPYPEKILRKIEESRNLPKPDPENDGLLPIILHRLQNNEPKLKKEGHLYKFAISRGPFNIASYLLGHSEFLLGLKMHPNRTKDFIELVTNFVIDWLKIQKEKFETIEGIFVLDDIIGFVNEDDFKEYALPYFKEIFNCFKTDVNFLHQDMESLVPAKHLNDMDVNLYNFSYKHDINKIKKLSQNKVGLLGNIPPRDVLADESSEEIYDEVKETLKNVENYEGLMVSCGGGMPPGVSTDKIQSFVLSVKENS